MPKIDRKEYLCTYCDKKFLSGDWFGCDGNKFRRHQVEPKTYLSTHDSHVICLTKEQTVVNPTTGESQKMTGYAAQFVNGHFTTSEPQYQEILDGIQAQGGLVNEETYVESKLTERQKTQRAKGQLVEQGALLEKAQQELERLKAQLAEKSADSEEVSAGAIPQTGGLAGRRRVGA